MKTITIINVLFMCVLTCPSVAQDSSHSEPPSPDVELSLSLRHDAIVAYEPVIARVSLTNRGEEPLTLKVRHDGTPHAIASLVALDGGAFFRHNQRLFRSGPGAADRILSPGESTSGEILILFGGPPTGLSFAKTGRYQVKIEWQPNPTATPKHSNIVGLKVSPDNRGNTALLEELSEITYAYYEYDRSVMVREYGEDYIIGSNILREIIRQEEPQRIDLEEQREVILVNSLTKLLEKYPDSSYSGYLARFLGLAKVEQLSQEHIIARRKAATEAEGSLGWDGATLRAKPVYKAAIHYLTMAAKKDLWPRPTATYNMIPVYSIGEEWDKVNTCCETLRTKYQDSGGRQIADKLEAQAMKYKHKLQMAKERQATQEVGSQSE